MPTYGYRCTNCAHEEDHFQKITDEVLCFCPACGQKTYARGPGGGIGLHFKGKGFYITDYPKDGKTKEPASAEKTQTSSTTSSSSEKVQSSSP